MTVTVAVAGTPQAVVRAASLSAPGAGTAAGSAARFAATASAANLKPTVVNELKHDTSPPLRRMQAAARRASAEKDGGEAFDKPFARTSKPGRSPTVQDPVVQDWKSDPNMPATTQNFTGITYLDNSPTLLNPPDTDGAVGPTQYVEWVNLSFAVYSKTGTVLLGPVQGNTLYAGFGGLCDSTNQGDPLVQYDQIAGRWVISQFAFTNTTSGPFLQCIAVSTTSDATGSWNRYAFTISATKLDDYGKIGVWPDGYYMSFNQFGTASGQCHPSTFWCGALAAVFDRAAMIAGTAATLQKFDMDGVDPNLFGLLPSGLDGSTAPPANTPNFFLAMDEFTPSSQLLMYKFHVDWSTPGNSTFTGPTNVAVASYDFNMCGFSRTCLPQSGTANKIDALSDRMMYALHYRNMGTHEVLVATHGVDVGSDHAGARWYEIRDPDGTPAVFQQGSYAPDATHRFNPSIAMDQDGNISLAYSMTSASMFPSIGYTGRLASDTLGTMAQGETTMFTGTGSLTSTSHRWGDYSLMSMDPTDDCTFWYVNEYMIDTSTSHWATRIGSWKFPGCPAVAPTITNPTFGTPSPATGSWTNDNTIDLGWDHTTASATNGVNAFALSADHTPSGPASHASPLSATSDGATIGPLASGTWYLHFQTQDGASTWGTPADFGPFMIDTTIPATSAVNGAGFSRLFQRLDLGFTISGTDIHSGVDPNNYGLYLNTANFNAAFGGIAPVFDPTASTAFNSPVSANLGKTLCFLAKVRDLVGNSRDSLARCAAFPLASNQLTRSSPTSRWIDGTGAAFYNGRFRRTTTNGAFLSRTGVYHAKHVEVVATTCNTCGSIRVFFGAIRSSTPSASFSLRTTSTRHLVPLDMTLSSAYTGTINIVVTSPNGKNVIIEGLGVSQR
jgi:hypothetical protein